VLGLWTIASPWIWGYWGNVAALWDNMAVGIAITVVAGWSGSASTAYEREHSPPTAVG
jgi:hypothetical protein